ncbi:MAG: T9SS type A sorting domain-containing protein [Crocinitomicaceae bacterium]|nr:T9SS type A sorting domain-containing protein [Crocinitomicaceae bacterium]
MKKVTTLVVVCLSFLTFGQHDHNTAQEKLDPLNQGVCGNNVEMEAAFAENPELRIQHEIDQANFELEYQQFLNEYDPNARAQYVIPVVVHIVHENGPENISNDQVYDAIMRLNEDFSMTNNDLSNTVAAFTGIIGNTDVEFRLATKDPDGNCHLGITRTYLPGGGAHDTGDNSFIRDAVQDEHGNWPQNRYMNVFVVKSIVGSAAYTNTPSNWYSPNGMGGSIYMGHTVMGSIGTSYLSNRHILSHEVGHWLNLSHCWGPNNSAGDPGSCTTDDGVSDTPNTIGWFGICDYDGETCGSLDNVQNIMDYAGSCRNMFTQGQSARMQTALNSSTAQRNNLWQTSNLLATGTLSAGELCAAQFSSNVQTLCAGQSVDFLDESYHNITSRTWTFDGGVPATSTSNAPSITYNTPGIYTVTLEVSDGNNTATNTATNYIVVLSDPGEAIPYHEGFGTLTSIPDNENWMQISENTTGSWELTSLVGSQNTYHSAMLPNFGNTDGSKDELISGSIDLSGVNPAESMYLSFDYAYRKVSSSDNEWLRFYISNDCGETWTLRKNLYGDDLSPLTQGTAYYPTGPEDWSTAEVLNINSAYYTANFRFKFQFENDGGNNLFIDNINLYPASVSSISDQENTLGLTVYPNPVSEKTKITLNGAGEMSVITIHSALGQQIDIIYQGELTNGINTFEYNMSGLAKGVYIIKVESEGRVQTIKLVKE